MLVVVLLVVLVCIFIAVVVEADEERRRGIVFDDYDWRRLRSRRCGVEREVGSLGLFCSYF